MIFALGHSADARVQGASHDADDDWRMAASCLGTPKPGRKARSMQPRPHQLCHVVRVEERSFRFSRSLQALFELAKRVAAALRMGIIGREHEQLGARLLHHPTNRLAWE